jgi:hypothetical protein
MIDILHLLGLMDTVLIGLANPMNKAVDLKYSQEVLERLKRAIKINDDFNREVRPTLPKTAKAGCPQTVAQITGLRLMFATEGCMDNRDM